MAGEAGGRHEDRAPDGNRLTAPWQRSDGKCAARTPGAWCDYLSRLARDGESAARRGAHLTLPGRASRATRWGTVAARAQARARAGARAGTVRPLYLRDVCAGAGI